MARPAAASVGMAAAGLASFSRSSLPRLCLFCSPVSSSLPRPIRSYSTASAVSSSSSSTSSSSDAPRRRPFPRPSTVIFLLLGATLAWPLYRRVAFLTPTVPEPGTAAEDEARAALTARAAKLPLLQELLDSPEWVEWRVGSRWADDLTNDTNDAKDAKNAKDAKDTTDSKTLRVRLTRNGLGGVRGMTGYHRIFLRPATGELVSIVHLGSALSGWPATAHGGAIATLLDEALGRCAFQALPAHTGVTARLELQYRRRVGLPDFYVVRTRPEIDAESADTADAAAAGKPRRKVWCTATLETLDGKTCVEARALFAVPRSYKLGHVEDRF